MEDGSLPIFFGNYSAVRVDANLVRIGPNTAVSADYLSAVHVDFGKLHANGSSVVSVSSNVVIVESLSGAAWNMHVGELHCVFLQLGRAAVEGGAVFALDNNSVAIASVPSSAGMSDVRGLHMICSKSLAAVGIGSVISMHRNSLWVSSVAGNVGYIAGCHLVLRNSEPSAVANADAKIEASEGGVLNISGNTVTVRSTGSARREMLSSFGALVQVYLSPLRVSNGGVARISENTVHILGAPFGNLEGIVGAEVFAAGPFSGSGDPPNAVVVEGASMFLVHDNAVRVNVSAGSNTASAGGTGTAAYDATNNPLHLFIGPSDGAAERGALLSCLVIMAAACVAVVAHSAVAARRAAKAPPDGTPVVPFLGLPLLGFPSVLLLPAAFTMRIAVRAGVRLAVLSEDWELIHCGHLRRPSGDQR